MNLHFMISNAYERICVDMSVYSCKYIPCMCSMGEGRSKASICKLPKLVSSSGFLVKNSNATCGVRKGVCCSEICLCHLCPSEMKRTALVEWV